MATRNWSGAAADGNWGTAGNWDTAPITGDDVIIAQTNGTFPDITSGLTTGINLNSLTITEGFYGKIGTTSAALSIAVTNGGTKKFIYAGRGDYCKITGNVTNSEIQHKVGLLAVSGGTWGTTGTHYLSSGEIEIDAAVVMAGTWYASSPANVRIGTNATAIPVLNSDGATIFIDARDVTASLQIGGNWTMQGDGQFTAHVAMAGTLFLWSSGTDTSIYNYGALVTVDGSRQSSKAIAAYGQGRNARQVFFNGVLNVIPSTVVPIGRQYGSTAVNPATS